MFGTEGGWGYLKGRVGCWSVFFSSRLVYFAWLRVYFRLLVPLLQEAQLGTVTLLYSARDTQHNNAVALKEFLEQRLK
jgi:hypothetical protein